MANEYRDRAWDRDYLIGAAFSLLGALQDEGTAHTQSMVKAWLDGYRRHTKGERANVWYLPSTLDKDAKVEEAK